MFHSHQGLGCPEAVAQRGLFTNGPFWWPKGQESRQSFPQDKTRDSHMAETPRPGRKSAPASHGRSSRPATLGSSKQLLLLELHPSWSSAHPPATPSREVTLTWHPQQVFAELTADKFYFLLWEAGQEPWGIQPQEVRRSAEGTY